jgi:uncharacterized coiled-coil protein SlyX
MLFRFFLFRLYDLKEDMRREFGIHIPKIAYNQEVLPLIQEIHMTESKNDSEPVEEIVQTEKPASEIVAVEEPQAIPPESTPKRPSFGQRVKRVLLFLLRLILVLVILAALAVGISYSLPLLYQKYIQPVRDNTAQLEQLNTRVAENQITITGLQTQLQAIQTELARQSESLSGLDGRVQTVEGQIQKHTQTLVALEQLQNITQEENKSLNAEMMRQIDLMKSMELLSRARLFMYQSNFGLARQDVQTARDLLVALQPTAPENLAGDLTEIIHRLDLTLSNLPAFPVAASDDLDIAWQVLLAGLPEVQATPVTETPAPAEGTSTATPIPTLEPTATP